MLSSYQLSTARLLKDTNHTFWSTTDLTDYVNQARTQMATVYGCLRVLINGSQLSGSSAVPGTMIPGGMIPGATNNGFQTITNVERYSYGYANAFAKQLSGVLKISDVISVSVSWAGNSSQNGVWRPALDWVPFEDMQAYYRAYNLSASTYPAIWSTTGDGALGKVFLYPVPGQALEMEWDCFAYPIPLADNSTYEALPASFTEYVPMYAAHLAYLGSQRYGAADMMLQLFEKNSGLARVAADRGKTERWYR